MSTFSHQSSMNEIHVLLIEQDGEDKNNIINTLERFSYKVTAVDAASIAMSILSKEKMQFDLVIVDMNSCQSSYVFHLLQETIKMNILAMLMCDEDNASTTMWALENGAFLCLKKPVSMEIIGCLWQHVVRDKLGKLKERDRFRDGMKFIAWEKELVYDGMEYTENDLISSEEHHNKNMPNSENSQNDNPMFMRRKVWTEWTQELHQKFMDAVIQLGEGRCYPKEILELMNVPGLTRMQVASHLQKCRNAKWLPPNKRKSKLGNMEKMAYAKNKAPRSKTMRFGSMPHLDHDSEFRLGIQEYHENHQEFTVVPPTQTHNVRDQNNEGSFDSSYYSQLVVDNANYSMAQNNESSFKMVPLENGFGSDETPMSVDSSTNSSTNQPDVTGHNVFEFSYMDSVVQNLSPSLGVDYNGGFHSLVQDQVHHKMPLATTNASANDWGWRFAMDDGEIGGAN